MKDFNGFDIFRIKTKEIKQMIGLVTTVLFVDPRFLAILIVTIKMKNDFDDCPRFDNRIRYLKEKKIR